MLTFFCFDDVIMKWLLKILGSLPLGEVGVLIVQLNSTTLLLRKVLVTETEFLCH